MRHALGSGWRTDVDVEWCPEGDMPEERLILVERLLTCEQLGDALKPRTRTRYVEWCGDWEEGFPEFLETGGDPRASEPLDYSTAPWAWVQCYPPMGFLAPKLFRDIRRQAGMAREAKHGQLRVRYKSRDVHGDVVASQNYDLRIYFGEERPELLRKTREQFAEIGEPQPDWNVCDIHGRPRAPRKKG